MREAGDSDTEKGPTNEDSTVELRRSCDYCVRLKRACDGKSPCTLCARRKKPCTRSARKKSGPAKGTKYAPRRKRSAIAEWADRAAGAVAGTVGGRGSGDPGRLPPHEVLHPGPGRVSERIGGGGSHPQVPTPLSPSLLSAPPMSPSSFLGSRPIGTPRVRGESPLGTGGRGTPRYRRGSDYGPPSPSHSPSAAGFASFRGERYPIVEPGPGATAGARSSSGGAVAGERRLAPRFEPPGGVPPGMGHAGTLGSGSAAATAFTQHELQQQQQRHGSGNPAVWTSWTSEATSRSGLSRLEAAAAAAVEAAAAAATGSGVGSGYSAPPVSASSGVASSFLSLPGTSTIMGGGPDPRRVGTREPSMDWGSSSSPQREMLGGPPSGLSHGGRIRLTPPAVPFESRSSSRHTQSPGDRDPSMSPRGFEGGRSASAATGSRSPEGGHRRRRGSSDERDLESSSSLPFRPPPREPPDPTAGFGFRSSTQLLSWKRSPQFVPWDANVRSPQGLISGRGPPPSPHLEPRGRSLERSGVATGGDNAGAGGGGDSGRERRWTMGMREEDSDVAWQREQHRQAPPALALPRVSIGSPQRRFEYYDRPRDWAPYGSAGDEARTHRDPRASASSSVTTTAVMREGAHRAETLGGALGAGAASVFERQEYAGDRWEQRTPGGSGFPRTPGSFFGGEEAKGGGAARDRRMPSDEQQWQRLDSRHQGRPEWGYEHPGMRILSPSILSGEAGVPPRVEEERRRRASEGGGSRAAGGWGSDEGGGRRMRQWPAGSARGSSTERGGGASEAAAPSTAPRGSSERELPGDGDVGGSGDYVGSPASRSSRDSRRSPMEIATPRSTSSIQGNEGGDSRQEEGTRSRDSEARTESVMPPEDSSGAPAPALPSVLAGSDDSARGPEPPGRSSSWRPAWEGSQPARRSREPSGDEGEEKDASR